MKTIKKFLLFLFIISIGLGRLSYAQPKIPKENIPSDISSEVRRQIERLYSSDPNERAKGADRLGKMGAKAAPAVPFLIAMFDKEYTIVDWPTAYGQAFLDDIVIGALVRIGEPAVEPLIVALKDKDPNIRWGAVAILDGIGDSRAVEPLIEALKDEDGSVRFFAAKALGRMGDGRAVEPLTSMLKNKDEDRGNRWEAAEVLANIGNAGIEPLIVALGDKNPTVREIVVWVVGDKKISDSRVIEPLIAFLQDKDPDIRKTAASSLGKIGASQAVESLIVTLKDDTWFVRLVAATALGDIGDKRATEALIVALKDEEQGVRTAAATALGNIGDNRAVEILIAALKDKESSVRREAARALGKIGGTSVVDPLITVFKDEDQVVRIATAEALEKITGRHFGQNQIKWQKWWEKNKHSFKKN